MRSWGMECVHEPGFTREKLRHTMKDLKPLGMVAWDDLIHINTQSGSQWDGLRHWGHQDTGLYYNGLKHDDISDPAHRDVNSLHHWSKRGGIVGRAVLIDYASWAERNGIVYAATARYEISVRDIEAIAKEQGVEFRPADILLIRTGWVKWYNDASDEDRIKGARDGHGHVGLAGNAESVEWLWDHHFAAVAGDNIAFEAWPPKAPHSKLGLSFHTWPLARRGLTLAVLHDYLLAMWGTPIGELWNLEELAEACKREKRYSFFLTSAPLNVRGGIGSPPNALAIL